ncbi:MAG: 50S ribosomal protein L21 [Planctomycetota bacterium]
MDESGGNAGGCSGIATPLDFRTLCGSLFPPTPPLIPVPPNPGFAMYAVIEDSGSQIKVAEGDVITLDKRELGEDQAELTLDKVLLVGGTDDAAKIGTPLVEGASVTAEILEEGKGDKIYIYKFKRRKDYRRKNGHRQDYVKVKITKIAAG